MKTGSCRSTTQRRRSKLGELTTTIIDPTALWATWPPKILLPQAGLARPEEARFFSNKLVQILVAGLTFNVVSSILAQTDSVNRARCNRAATAPFSLLSVLSLTSFTQPGALLVLLVLIQTTVQRSRSDTQNLCRFFPIVVGQPKRFFDGPSFNHFQGLADQTRITYGLLT